MKRASQDIKAPVLIAMVFITGVSGTLAADDQFTSAVDVIRTDQTYSHAAQVKALSTSVTAVR